MSEIQCFPVEPCDIGERIDKFLSVQIPDKTRSSIQKLIEQEAVTCCGKVISKNYKVREKDIIEVILPALVFADIKSEDIALDVIYEDDDLLVVNKAKGMVVHPAAGNYEGTLVNALLHHCHDSLSGINGVIRPGIVHRIDKDTSGLLIVAKNDVAHVHLADQIKKHSFTREYEAIVHGVVKTDHGVLDFPLGRHQNDRKKMCVTDRNAKQAITHFSVIEHYEKFTHMRFQLETGRTHQIRVHMAHIGHPVAGDEVYGPNAVVKNLNGQCLHAKKIGFIHPTTNEYLEFDSPLPPLFQTFLQKLSNKELSHQ